MRTEVLAYHRGYRVTEDGVLINPKGESIGYPDDGYEATKMRVNGKCKKFYTHRLQAFQKYGFKLHEKGIMVRHKNGNSADNSWDNILIGTNSDNQMDIPEQVRIKRALHATSFVRKYNKEEVRKFHEKSKSYKKTMEHFSISSKGTLYHILKK